MPLYGLKFRTLGQTSYYSGPDTLHPGDHVLIAAEQGETLAEVVSGPHESLPAPYADAAQDILRPATDEDRERARSNAVLAQEAAAFCRQCIRQRRLDMKLVEVEVYFDRSKFIFYFTAPADTLPTLRGLNFDERDAFIIEKPTGRIDTLHYWIKDSLLYVQDTLKMSLTYLYTDTLNQLVPRTDTLRLVSKVKPKTEEEKAKEREEKEKERKKRRKKDEPEPVYTEFLPMDVYAPGTMDIYDYLTLTFQEPVASIDTAAMHLQQKVDTLWHDVAFDFQQDSTDLKKYNIFADWEWGESYAFSIDSTAIHGLYGLFTDKVKKEFKMKKPEEYGQIFFNVTGTVGPCFVELLDGQDKVLRTVKVVDGKADFYYLNPGKYGARLVEDANDNGVWDTGLYAEKRQPERVYYYPQVLELKANFDLLQDWNVLQLPLDKQKPNELKKQKPDEDKKKNRNRNNNRR